MVATRGSNVLLLEPLLQASRDSKGDLEAAIAAVRKLLPEQPSLVSSEALFKDARRRWTDQKDPGVSTDQFALLVIACRWDKQLEQFLLQNHAADALADLKSLLRAWERLPSAAASTLPLLDALLTVALLFIFGYEQSDDTTRHARCLEDNMTTSSSHCLCERFPSAASILSQHIKRPNRTSNDAWKNFFELPIALDDRKFNSKSGRAFGTALLQVAEQQDYILSMAHRRCSEDPSHLDSQHDGERRVVLEQLWEVARQVLKAGSTTDTTEGCVKCIKTSSDNTKVPAEAHDQVTVIFDDESLKSYLAQKAAVDSHVAQKIHAMIPAPYHEDQQISQPKDSDMRHFTRLLDELHRESSAATTYNRIAEFVPKAQEELSTLTDLSVLGIQVSYLLAAQLRSNKRLANMDSEIHRRYTRQVLRVFNSLTDGSDIQQQHHVSELVTLAGFCPSEIIQEILRRSMVTPQYNHMYIQVFQVCPILLVWKRVGSNELLVILELKKIFKEMIAAPNLFESQSRNFVELLHAFTKAPKSATGRAGGAAVIQVQSLIQDVMLPVHHMLLEDRTEMTKYLTMLREFVGYCVSDSRWTRSASGAAAFKALLGLLTSTYARELKVDSLSSLSLKNTLLLSVKDLVVLAWPPGESSVFEEVSSILVDLDELDDPLLMLLAHAVSAHDFWHDRLELQPLRLLSESFDRSATAGKTIDLDAGHTREAVRLLLWKLLWESACSETRENGLVSPQQSQLLITKVRAWELLKFVAEQSFEDAVDDSESSSVAGSALIRREIAQIMLRCDPSLFAVLYTEVLTKLAKYDTVELQFPDERLRQFDARDNKASNLLISLRSFQSSHAIMKYVLECWTPQVISGIRFDDSRDKVAAVLVMARHVLVSIDSAVAASTSSLFELLHCFQWVCYTIWVVDAPHLREFESSHSIRNQLEIAVLRLLYLLDQAPVVAEEHAKYSRRFVASWTAYLPQKSYEQLCNFVSSAKRDL